MKMYGWMENIRRVFFQTPLHCSGTFILSLPSWVNYQCGHKLDSQLICTSCLHCTECIIQRSAQSLAPSRAAEERLLHTSALTFREEAAVCTEITAAACTLCAFDAQPCMMQMAFLFQLVALNTYTFSEFKGRWRKLLRIKSANRS